MTPEITKRFIAGAVCPRCGQLDKLVLYWKEKQQLRECVRCGFQDVMTEDDSQKELETRVNQITPGEASLSDEDEIQVVNIVDSNPGGKRRDH